MWLSRDQHLTKKTYERSPEVELLLFRELLSNNRAKQDERVNQRRSAPSQWSTCWAHMLGSLGTFEYGLRAGKLHTFDSGLRVECTRMFEYVLHTNETNVDELNDDEETTHADRTNPTAALSMPLPDDVAETNSPTSLVAGSSGVSHEICAEDDSTSGEAVCGRLTAGRSAVSGQRPGALGTIIITSTPRYPYSTQLVWCGVYMSGSYICICVCVYVCVCQAVHISVQWSRQPLSSVVRCKATSRPLYSGHAYPLNRDALPPSLNILNTRSPPALAPTRHTLNSDELVTHETPSTEHGHRPTYGPARCIHTDRATDTPTGLGRGGGEHGGWGARGRGGEGASERAAGGGDGLGSERAGGVAVVVIVYEIQRSNTNNINTRRACAVDERRGHDRDGRRSGGTDIQTHRQTDRGGGEVMMMMMMVMAVIGSPCTLDMSISIRECSRAGRMRAAAHPIDDAKYLFFGATPTRMLTGCHVEAHRPHGHRNIKILIYIMIRLYRECNKSTDLLLIVFPTTYYPITPGS
ncbi:unnamed protein product [Danaus chrysippus]|uniref:(African queen) hypothetical protein n=1 Tax=Danaus chrysippus TaxID=151541 RepID=A0A8J2VWR7_9NEOP|nr:unnamed protein product [Danaus chrysippus]